MRIVRLIVSLCLPILVVGCDRAQPVARFTEPPGHSEVLPESQSSVQAAHGEPIAEGTVTETMDTAGYTYVQVETNGEKIWAAAPQFKVSVGDRVTVPAGMAMHDYHSQTLDRDFDVVYFVSTVRNHSSPEAAAAGGSAMHSAHPPAGAAATPETIDLGGIERPEGGKTIAEIYADKAQLAGKKITVRGKVVKFNAQIMGKNWLHVRDGSGDADEKNNDLTVTTAATARPGDTVLVKGELHLDRDFGFGYKYDVIVEDAEVKVE
ncbi:MAG: hypothetical protein GXY83_07165 [Rhodopirellula sp.]|nr:hypothetical protein [Rhodopirellula sp.]